MEPSYKRKDSDIVKTISEIFYEIVCETKKPNMAPKYVAKYMRQRYNFKSVKNSELLKGIEKAKFEYNLMKMHADSWASRCKKPKKDIILRETQLPKKYPKLKEIPMKTKPFDGSSIEGKRENKQN